MDFEYVIKTRTATRKFQDKKVEKEKINKILESARLAPTAKNQQPQKIYVVSSEESLKKIDNATPCRYNAPVVFIVCSDKEIACHSEQFSTAVIDGTIVATHMMLASTNLGVDNIWIEYFDKQKLKEEFNIPEKEEIICLLPIGYKDVDCPSNPMHEVRKELKEIVKYL